MKPVVSMIPAMRKPRAAVLCAALVGLLPGCGGSEKEPKTLAPADLAGAWLMTMPAGAEREVAIRQEGEKGLRLEKAARFSGLYELRDGRLVMVQPQDRREMGFEWEVRGPDEMALVAVRPELKKQYVGATLRRIENDGLAQRKEVSKPQKEQTADAKRPVAKTPVAPPERWLIAIPTGAKYEVAIRREGTTTVHLQKAGRFSGRYELRNSRLVMAQPLDPLETGFEWEVRGADEMALVAVRPELENQYVGTTLTRVKDGKDQKPLK